MAASTNESAGTNVAGTNVIVTRISELVTPIVIDLGLDLYDLEFVSGVVRVVVDTKPGMLGENGQPAGVDLEKIGLLTRLISKEFDHSEPVPGRYTLEVTSPGLERNLRLPRHYIREVNKIINVRLTAPLETGGERRVQGVLVSADDREITVRNSSDVEVKISYATIDRAKTVFKFETTSKKDARHSKNSKHKFATTTEAKAS
ncbi:MAG: ribosome maturation factor RimP [Actinomycetota bacterium]